MWTLAFLWAFAALNLQVSTCDPSCDLYELIVYCPSKNHYWVPALPSNITHLFLDRNYISEINSTSLQDYEDLEVLDLGGQNVNLVLRNNAFVRQRKLTRLVLDQLGYSLLLEPRAFAGLINVRNLSLAYCNLDDSILSGNYLEPLLSLTRLELSFNQITRLRPGLFFSNLQKFTELKLKLNKIQGLCEEDLVGFRGKTFTLMDMSSNKLLYLNDLDFDWKRCGNPFRDIAFNFLDISSNIFNNISTAKQFFKSIEGTQISHLKFSGTIGKDFSHDNLPDPDNSTFEGLVSSSLEILDLSKSFIFALKMAVFSHFKDVIIIDLSQNKINQINNDAFTGLQGHLRMLNLSSNLLGEIRSDTFMSLTDLRVLDLSNNHIGILGYKAFDNLPKLRALYLTGNSLRNLDFPSPLPNLELLLLGDNKLESLHKITEFGLNSIHIDVSDNRLKDLGNIFSLVTEGKRLQNLFYGGNLFKWCTPSPKMAAPYNNSLKVLDLHDSYLQGLWGLGKCLDLFDNFNNLLGLNISFNLLASLPQGIFRGLSRIIEIDLSFNALTHLQPGVFPVSLKHLDLSNNFLAAPDPMSFMSLTYLNLAENRFHCDCKLESFLIWLFKTDVIFLNFAEEMRCGFPAALHNLPLLDYNKIFEPCKDEVKSTNDLQLALFILSAILITTFILCGIVYARFRGQVFVFYKRIVSTVLEGPTPNPPVEESEYDAFLCFSNNDYRWVEAALLKKLDKHFSEKNVFRCCFEARDFLPGVDHLSNIRDAIWSSRKTLCIVSQEFLKDGWCLEAFTLAQGRMLEELTNVLIMMVVGKVPYYQLMKSPTVRSFVRRREYLTWPEDPQDLEWFYEHLTYHLIKDTQVKKLAEDQPKPVKGDVQNQHEGSVELEDIRTTAM
ncbi:Toll-like receptor 5 Precursor [Channa argus]|uniref:Toll-like receptor 5 n=1 Tax=Channa argus TaxID=215402 RepID=A0A6G1QJC9_CHAAH|nr:Toll-like receptor 5 Precursor [Channa argus]KAK2890438.1 hypothetical protein Q8A73_018738 [Channa argus]